MIEFGWPFPLVDDDKYFDDFTYTAAANYYSMYLKEQIFLTPLSPGV